MNHYAGIDVSLDALSLCAIDTSGNIVREAKVASEPEALIAWFGAPELELTRIGLEAGRCRNGFMPGCAMRVCGRAVGNAARAKRIQDHVGEDRPRACPWHCRADGAASSGLPV
jgi:hypothetical protein